MHFRILAVCLLMISTQVLAVGRSPAVEDFVGIEVDEPQATPQGTEPLFNFEQDLTKHTNHPTQNDQLVSSQANSTGWSVYSIFGVTLALGLPMGVWLMLMSYLRKKATLANAANIEVLENYRKQKELGKKAQDSVRKVS